MTEKADSGDPGGLAPAGGAASGGPAVPGDSGLAGAGAATDPGGPAEALAGPVAVAGVEAGADLGGVPDGIERLWVPHRMAYVGGASRPANAEPDDCPFCLAPGREDAEALIVARGEMVYALLNLFPYNPGHLLICPYRHVPELTDLTSAEASELMEFTRRGVEAVRRARAPQGFNLGMNLGAVAGAGISAHLHQHVVPRWTGDSNFFPILAHSRALPELLGATREAVAAAWDGS
ncbi:MAG: HIT domain-containing protein [Bifidobacteriaceae bacterium]|jgi:ATP adenylyltransferase|nr:HIT domain-containing protein [Bifidobacteriaceae bacterium]